MNNRSSILAFLILLLYLLSCGKDDFNRENRLRIDDKSYFLTSAVFDELNDDSNLKFKRTAFCFGSNEFQPSVYLKFVMYEPTNNSQKNRIYSYSFKPGSGCVSHITLGSEVIYDEHNVPLAGDIFNESNSEFVGTVEVIRKRKKTIYAFDLTIEHNGIDYLINGQYKGGVEEGFVSY